ncbi:hypothetical protein B1F79_05165 [Coxiella-like endosymbiont of Rhipicephalus sanguineus]|nr:hypothetical protein [Coxiella-like endosymbiont of Rhipicephalus sanguineus]
MGNVFFLLNYTPYSLSRSVGSSLLVAASVQIIQLIPFILLGLLLTAIQVTIGNFMNPNGCWV